MKKLLTLALAASMILAMSVNAFALGNYVALPPMRSAPKRKSRLQMNRSCLPNQPAGRSRRSTRTPATEDFVGVAAAARCCCRHRIGSTEKEISFSVCTRVLFLGRGIFLIAAAFWQRIGAKTLCFASDDRSERRRGKRWKFWFNGF